MRVALYARVSTEEQAMHGLSIDAQLAALREFAGDRSVGEYVDAGVSARIPITKRPELQRLLRDVESGKIDLVAFVKLDRWTRNIREYYKAQDVLDAHSVAWRAIHEDYETETAAGRLKVNIMLAVAQDEADRTSERVKAVFQRKREQGLVVCPKMPYGLRYVDGHIEPTEDLQKVKTLYERYCTGASMNAICNMTSEILGVPYSLRGTKELLENTKYREYWPDLWDRAALIMQQRSVRTSRTDRVYLFAGVLVCPVCGRKLTARASVRNGYTHYYYRCDRNRREERCSWSGGVSEKKLESWLLENLMPCVEEYNLEVKKKQAKPIDTKAIQKKLDRIADLYIEGSISKEDYDSRSAPLRDQLKTQTTHEVDPTSVMTALETYNSLSRPAKRGFWRYLLKTITPTPEGFTIALL